MKQKNTVLYFTYGGFIDVIFKNVKEGFDEIV